VTDVRRLKLFPRPRVETNLAQVSAQPLGEALPVARSPWTAERGTARAGSASRCRAATGVPARSSPSCSRQSFQTHPLPKHLATLIDLLSSRPN